MTEAEYREFYRQMEVKAHAATRAAFASRSSQADVATSPIMKALGEIVAPVIADVVKRAKQDADRIVALQTRQAALEARVAMLEQQAVSVSPGPSAASSSASARGLRRVV